MIIDYLTNLLASSSTAQTQPPLLIEINGKTGSFSTHIAAFFPSLTCLVQDPSLALIQKGQSSLPVSLAPRISFEQRDLFAPRTLKELDSYDDSGEGAVIILLRSVLWNLPDAEVVELLKSFVPMLDRKQGSQKRDVKLLVSDLVSPTYGTFAPDTERERPFRRRDVTLMTMHNVKQRTAGEWGALIGEGVEGCEVCISVLYFRSASVSFGLWETVVAKCSLCRSLTPRNTPVTAVAGCGKSLPRLRQRPMELVTSGWEHLQLMLVGLKV